MSDTFLRVTWIDVDREVERDISTREQKLTYKLDVNVKVTFVLFLCNIFAYVYHRPCTTVIKIGENILESSETKSMNLPS